MYHTGLACHCLAPTRSIQQHVQYCQVLLNARIQTLRDSIPRLKYQVYYSLNYNFSCFNLLIFTVLKKGLGFNRSKNSSAIMALLKSRALTVPKITQLMGIRKRSYQYL